MNKQPALALPYCDRAVGRISTGYSREARGIAYAQLGRLPEATLELQAFQDWLAGQPESLRMRYGSTRSDWLLALKAGTNPIDDAALAKLREE
ncbi:MAG: hypothetical protein HY675_17035 [Chloroflexi bacterium]|nr:hypothetical protein [Chloroflexota bacterium]